jgi:hypothetical protein
LLITFGPLSVLGFPSASQSVIRSGNRAPGRALGVVVCGAGPAADAGKLVTIAQQRDWAVRIIATPAALSFLGTSGLETH